MLFRGAGLPGARPLSLSVSGEFSDAWPLMRSPVSDDDDVSFPDSCTELTGEDVHSLGLVDGSTSPTRGQGLPGGAAAIQAPPENCSETAESFRSSSPAEPAPPQGARAARIQPDPSTQTPPQVSPAAAADPREGVLFQPQHVRGPDGEVCRLA